jgi:membrane-associated phospholipid phosphatase
VSAADRLASVWLVGLALLAAVRHPAPIPLVVAAATTVAGVIAVAAWATHSRVGRVVHDFLPIALIPIVFNLAGPVIAAANSARWDGVLAGIDARFCGSLVSAWRNALGRPTLLTDLAYVAYVSFYFVPLAMAVALYRSGRGDDFDSFVFAVMMAFFLPYVGYLVFPATGPRIPLASEAQVLGGSAVAEGIRAVLRVAEVNKLDAFPSGHAAVSLVFLVLGARLFPRWRVPLVAIVVAILFATVYLSLHYLIDLFAGAVVAALVPAVITLLPGGSGSREQTRVSGHARN